MQRLKRDCHYIKIRHAGRSMQTLKPIVMILGLFTTIALALLELNNTVNNTKVVFFVSKGLWGWAPSYTRYQLPVATGRPGSGIL